MVQYHSVLETRERVPPQGGFRLKKSLERLIGSKFLFQELVKRDFKQKYKGTVLGIGWSMLSPVLTLLVMRIVFTEFFGRDKPFYTTYLFAGVLFFSYYSESTRSGMSALASNASILQKVNVPKYLFVLSKNVSVCVDFMVELLVFFVFAAIDGVTFTWRYILLIYPIVTMTAMNIGIGLILSAMFVYFRDTKYLYDVFVHLLRYLSAVFYYVDRYARNMQRIFLLNPVYVHIKYVRTIVIDGHLLSPQYHLLMAGYALFFLGLGCLIYKKKNHDFIYHL